MKCLLLVAASAVALGVGACAPSGPPAARAALDCPATEGDLTRQTVAPDRRSCTYLTGDGGEVILQLVNTDGDPHRALQALETSLIETRAPAAPGEPAEVDANEQTARDAARVAEEARQDANASVTVDIDVKGGKVVTNTAGGSETTKIDLPGIHIVAGEEKANVRIGAITVNAQDDEATVRIFTDQRLKGEAFSREKRGLKATFIHTGDNLASGYSFVGYEAAGPKAGPLTVALVRSRKSDGDSDDIHDDVKRLVRLNSGV